MLPLDQLKKEVNRQGLKKYESILLVLASLGGGPVSVNEIREQASKGGVKIASKTNVSALLSATKGLALKTSEGWELTEIGHNHLKNMGVVLGSSPAKQVAYDLRKYLSLISNADTRGFLEEAIECCERGLLRSAVVMSWIGAVHILYDYVIKKKLKEFNAEALRINKKHKKVSNIDELAKSVKEADFLNILENISVISNSLKKELKGCLDRRNSCGHPNSYKLTQNTVAHHIEVLLANIYQKFV